MYVYVLFYFFPTSLTLKAAVNSSLPTKIWYYFPLAVKAGWENHLPEETTYEQLHFFVGPQVFFVSNPSLNLGG